MNSNATHFFLQQEVSSYTTAMDVALLRLNRARTPRDLLAAFHARPHQKPLLRCMPEAKRYESRFQAACQRIAVQVIGDAFDQLEASIGSPHFCQQRFQLQREVQAISREVPQVNKIATQRFQEIGRKINAIPTPVRDSQCARENPI